MSNAAQYVDIGERLAAIRRAFGTDETRDNQTAWAMAHGFNRTQYHNWESGHRRIPVESSERLCEAYGLTLDFMYRGRRDGLSEYARKML